MATPRVFISHASADADFANRLADDLRQLGADAWLDSSHIGAGDFVAHINAALAGRDTVILVLTPTSIQSPWVNREINTAIARETQGFMHPMIVVMAQPCDLATVPPLWTTYHRYDATRDYDSALQGVAKQLDLASPKTPPLKPQPVLSKPLFSPTPQHPASPQAPISAGRLGLATLAVLATFILSVRLLTPEQYSLVLAVRYTAPAELAPLSIPFLLVSQAIGLWALWGAVPIAWARLRRKPHHPLLAGGFAIVEAFFILAIILGYQIVLVVARGTNRPPGWLYEITNSLFLGSLGLFVIVLGASCVVAGTTRQWTWLLWMLAPFAALAFILYVLNFDYTSENLRLAAESLLDGLPATWLFIALSFALFGAARRG